MRASVIISNFNGLRFLSKLLESLRNQSNGAPEIIVVDRHSTDGSREFLARQADVKVAEHPAEAGLVSGYAVGYSLATQDHLYFSNEDMWLDKHCLESLELALNPEQRVAVADPWQWTYDGRNWIHGVTRFRSTKWSWNSPYPFRKAEYCSAPSATLEIPYPCAGAFMIHRTAFEEVGGWDTRFFLDHEDVDLGLRLWKSGWKSVSVPRAKVYHAVGASNAQVLEQGKQRVSEKRYISGRANLMMVQFKHLSAPLIPAIGLWWALELVKNVAKGDAGLVRGALRAGRFTLENLPALVEDRRRLRGRSPGLAPFFTNATFNET
jgi:GT2 family glycosyltransferase